MADQDEQVQVGLADENVVEPMVQDLEGNVEEEGTVGGTVEVSIAVNGPHSHPPENTAPPIKQVPQGSWPKPPRSVNKYGLTPEENQRCTELILKMMAKVDQTRVGVKATQCSPVYTFIVFIRLVQ